MSQSETRRPRAVSEAVPEAFPEGFWDVSRTDYHADRTCDSHSTLEVFRRSIPLYHALFVKGGLPVPGPTADQAVGIAMHTLVLEPDKWDLEVAVPPEVDGRTKRGKALLDQFHERLAERPVPPLVLTQSQVDLARNMAEAALRHPGVQDLLRAPGVVERPLRWVDPLTWLPLRALPDKMVQGGPILDLKTALDPTPGAFGKACAQFGYHRQAALYLQARAHALRHNVTAPVYDQDGTFVFAVVGKSPPHEVVLYRLDQQAVDLGREQCLDTLKELQDCKDFGRWRSRHQVDGGFPVPLSLPAWAFTRK